MCFSPNGSQPKQYKKTLLWSKNMDQLQQYKQIQVVLFRERKKLLYEGISITKIGSGELSSSPSSSSPVICRVHLGTTWLYHGIAGSSGADSVQRFGYAEKCRSKKAHRQSGLFSSDAIRAAKLIDSVHAVHEQVVASSEAWHWQQNASGERSCFLDSPNQLRAIFVRLRLQYQQVQQWRQTSSASRLWAARRAIKGSTVLLTTDTLSGALSTKIQLAL
ncbi:hypothetical protein PInf_010203 [Phytophthora infestans]|nr:hypothetical protein PInf_010203 [Phytophthora infestans]